MLIFHQQFSYFLLLLCTTAGVAVGIITSYPGRRCHGRIPVPVPVSVPIAVPVSVPVTSAVCTSCLDYTVPALTIVIAATGHAASVVTATGRIVIAIARVVVATSAGGIAAVAASTAEASVITGISAGTISAAAAE